MRTLNFRYKKFQIGSKVIMTKDYINGNVVLKKGDVGTINGISMENLPDIGLFNIRVLSIKFNNSELHMGDQIAATIMDEL